MQRIQQMLREDVKQVSTNMDGVMKKKRAQPVGFFLGTHNLIPKASYWSRVVLDFFSWKGDSTLNLPSAGWQQSGWQVVGGNWFPACLSTRFHILKLETNSFQFFVSLSLCPFCSHRLHSVSCRKRLIKSFQCHNLNWCKWLDKGLPNTWWTFLSDGGAPEIGSVLFS